MRRSPSPPLLAALLGPIADAMVADARQTLALRAGGLRQTEFDETVERLRVKLRTLTLLEPTHTEVADLVRVVQRGASLDEAAAKIEQLGLAAVCVGATFDDLAAAALAFVERVDAAQVDSVFADLKTCARSTNCPWPAHATKSARDDAQVYAYAKRQWNAERLAQRAERRRRASDPHPNKRQRDARRRQRARR